MKYGTLEAGGTKMIVGVLDDDGNILDRASIPTTTPEETMKEMINYFKDKDIVSLGIGSFGPCDINKDSATFGTILDTPKAGWKNYPILTKFKEALNIPIGFDTDVDVAMLGEKYFGQAKDYKNCMYITIGTGIGGGVIVNNELIHGSLHTEIGHILLPIEKDDRDHKTSCPYHNNCFEGLASGPSLKNRWGINASKLSGYDKVWDLEARYIAKALVSYIYCYSPELIILGGGVMKQETLFPLIRKYVLKDINGYLKLKELKDIDHYIVPCSLNDNQGILGCLKLAIDAYKGAK